MKKIINVMSESGKIIEQIEVEEEEYFNFAMRFAERKGELNAERKYEQKLLEKCKKCITPTN